jgi:excisionase family DNA binding protein
LRGVRSTPKPFLLQAAAGRATPAGISSRAGSRLSLYSSERPERRFEGDVSVVLSTRQAAERLGISQPLIYQLIGEGRLSAQKVGRGYVINEED